MPPEADLLAAADSAQAEADGVGDDALDGTDYGHLQAATPPGADGDQRLCRADRKVGQ